MWWEQPRQSLWVTRTRSRHATCTYSCTRPPRRSRRSVCVPRTLSPSLSSTFPEGDLDITVPTRASMIACCGPRTRLPDARSRTELAGAARPLRRRQGRRDPDASERGRGTASHKHPAETDLARPRRAQRTEQTAARRVAPGAAGVTPNPAALAPPARRPPLDLPAPTTRPTTHRTGDPRPRAADGPREPPLGLQTNSRASWSDWAIPWQPRLSGRS
jgi:hypothetical protein